jgi:hypothetical protein
VDADIRPHELEVRQGSYQYPVSRSSARSYRHPPFFAILEDKKRGNSDHIDRIDVIECFVRTFGKARIEAVIADREFIGKPWLDYLEAEHIAYVFRLKEDGQYISNSRGEMVKIRQLLHPLKAGETVSLGKRKVGKTDATLQCVTATRSAKGELLVVIHPESLSDPIAIYTRRWDIETMFKALKSSGFNLEDTHLTDYDRIQTLLCVTAIAFCIAYKTGEITVKAKPLLIKSHGSPARSIFRAGLDALRNLVANIAMKSKNIKRLFKNIENIVLGGIYQLAAHGQKIVR